MRLPIALLSGLVLASAACAQAPDSGAGLPLGPAAPAAAQASFDEGLDLLHCFWDFEAARAFREASAAAPDLALPQLGLWWALAPNQAEEAEARRAALAAAVASAADEGELVRELVRLYADLAGGGSPEALRDGLARLAERFPAEPQLRILLARELVLGVTGHVHHGGGHRPPLERARDLLAEHLAAAPEDLAAHHYTIHAHELLAEPAGAVASAAFIRERQPACGHLRHMPGHVDYLLGDYASAREAFLDAEAFDSAYLERSGVSPLDHWNYVHNLTYLVAADAEAGRYEEALRWAARLAELPVSPHRGMSLGLGYVVYGGLTAEARVHWRFGRWDAAVAAVERHLQGPTLPSREAGAYLVGLAAYLRGRGAAAAGALEDAERYQRALFGVVGSLTQREATLGSDWYFEPARRVLAVAAVELEGVIRSLRGDHDGAVDLLRQAARMQRALGYAEPPHYPQPVHETLGEALLRAGRYAEARDAFAAALGERPESGFAWAGIARAEAGGGDAAAAAAAWDRARAAWSAADPVVRQLLPAEPPAAP